MTRLAPILLILLINFSAQAQDSLSIPVPEVIYFADLELTLTESVRKDVQTSVDALLRSKKYFQLQVDKVDAYFPIIERVLREEGLPDDFKYLAVQESALIPDAVSSSNAVGFWQFKKETAVEMGLRVDDTIDERMNIVSSTKAATKYLKKHNTYLENWLFSLLSYYSGLGGVQNLIDKSYTGKTKMTLDGNTHWYIKKFLAHKIAFENAHGKNANPPITLKEYMVSEELSVNQLAAELDLDESKLKEFNKWIKKEQIPSDKKYSLILATENPSLIAKNEENEIASSNEEPISAEEETEPSRKLKSLKLKVNGIDGIVAIASDDLTSISQKGGVTSEKFLVYNDLNAGEPIVDGQFYYLKPKKSKSSVLYHTVKEGETMWSISQKYGVKLEKLLDKNRMSAKEELLKDRVVWLKSTRPAKQEVEYRLAPIKEEVSQQVALVIDDTNETQSEIEEEDEEILDEGTIDVSIVNKDSTSLPLIQVTEVDSAQTKTDSLEIAPIIIKTEEQKVETIQIKVDFAQFEVNESVKFVNEESNKNEQPIVFDQHQVLAGETLFAIARKYSVTVAQICEWNGIDMNQGLKVGDILKIKTVSKIVQENTEIQKPVDTKQDDFSHKVIAGETLYNIAKKYGLSLKEIMDLNQKSDFTISIGEQLKVKKKD